MTPKIQTFADLFDEYEAERIAKAKLEMAAEDAAWNALPQEEKDRIFAEREAKLAAFEDSSPTDDDDFEDDFEEDEE